MGTGADCLAGAVPALSRDHVEKKRCCAGNEGDQGQDMKSEKRSLNDLYGSKPLEPPYPTQLVESCEKACAIPLKDLSTSQIRLLVCQKTGLEWLMPLALEILRNNPLIEATHFQGDLLQACLNVEEEFWRKHEDMWSELNGILGDLDEVVKDLKPHRETFMGFVGVS